MEDDMIVLEGIRSNTRCIVCAQIVDGEKANCKAVDSSEELLKSSEKVVGRTCNDIPLLSVLLTCLTGNNELKQTNANNLDNFHGDNNYDSKHLLHICQTCETYLVELDKLSKEIVVLNRRLRTLKYTVIAKFASAAGNQEDDNDAAENMSLTLSKLKRIRKRLRTEWVPDVVLERLSPWQLATVLVSTELDAVDDEFTENKSDDDYWPSDASCDPQTQTSRFHGKDSKLSRSIRNIRRKTKKPSGKKIGGNLRCKQVGPNEFLYAEQFKISLDGGKYFCGLCSYSSAKKDNVLTHLRRRHIRDKRFIRNAMLEKLSPSQLATVPMSTECDSANTEHKSVDDSRPSDVSGDPEAQTNNFRGKNSKLSGSIRKKKRKKKDSSETTLGGNQKCIQVGPNEFLYAGEYKISFDGVKYSCGLCSSSLSKRDRMLTHIRRIHIRDKATTHPLATRKLQLVAVNDIPNKYLYRKKYEVDLIPETGAYKCTACGLEQQSAMGVMEHIDSVHYRMDRNKRWSESSTKLIAPNEFLYNGKYPFKYIPIQQTYLCGLCEYQTDNRHRIYPHIRTSHYTSQDKQEFTAVQVSENEYLYGGKYRVFFKAGKYTCGICSCQRFNLQDLYGHIRSRHTDAEAEKINPEVVHPEGDVSVGDTNNVKYEFKSQGIPYSYEGLSRKFTCSVCSASVTHRTSMLAHIKTFHTGRTRQYVCEVCGDSFHGERLLRRHQSRHEAPKYNCQHCGKLFRSVKNFKSHVALHELGEEAKTFQCEYCGKRFAQKKYLDTHVRIHTGEKPYKCDLCDEMFADTAKVFYH